MKRAVREPARDAYILLKIVFAAAPILAGCDKFFHVLVNWNQYLSLHFEGGVHRSDSVAQMFLIGIGFIEIFIGLGVIFRPRLFANVVGVWLALVIINLIVLQSFFDVILRDFGLCLSAFALGRLAKVYGS